MSSLIAASLKLCREHENWNDIAESAQPRDAVQDNLQVGRLGGRSTSCFIRPVYCGDLPGSVQLEVPEKWTPGTSPLFFML